MTSSVQTMRIFAWKKSLAAASSGLLDSASTWAIERSVQGDESATATPMLILQEEMINERTATTFRQFCVFDISTFLTSVHNRSTPMFYHEIIPLHAPAKLAFDLEADFESKLAPLQAAFGTQDVDEIRLACSRLCEQLITATLVELSKQTGRAIDRTGVVVLDCSREEKWSKHVVFDGSNDVNDSIVFATDRDCAFFVKQLIGLPQFTVHSDALKLIVDQGVYNDRHPLRTYFSAKRKKQHQIMQTVPPAGVCHSTIMARTLRSCFIVHNESFEAFHQSGSTRYVTSSYLSRHLDALRAAPIRLTSGERKAVTHSSSIRSTAAPRVSNEALINLLVHAPELQAFAPHAARFSDDNTVVIDCRTVECQYHVNGRHRAGHFCVFLVVDLLRQQFVQMCNSSNCQDRRQQARPLRHKLSNTLASAVRDYLCSANWPPGFVVGEEFLRALGKIK